MQMDEMQDGMTQEGFWREQNQEQMFHRFDLIHHNFIIYIHTYVHTTMYVLL
jgi:hypothetical protein